MSFWFTVFDADTYQGVDGYCVGDDELSRSVLAHGVWEPWETAVALDILSTSDPGVVFDFGAHVGWYTILAATVGRDVVAVDADREHVDVLDATVAANTLDDWVHVARGWVDESTVALPPGGQVRFAKSDLEGGDLAAVSALRPLLEAGLVDYLLIEVSPEFGDGWMDVVGQLGAVGYAGFVVPTKGDDLDTFEADPLTVTLGRPLDVGLVEVQTSVLFTRV